MPLVGEINRRRSYFQKETPAKGRGFEIILRSVSLFPPCEGFFPHEVIMPLEASTAAPEWTSLMIGDASPNRYRSRILMCRRSKDPSIVSRQKRPSSAGMSLLSWRFVVKKNFGIMKKPVGCSQRKTNRRNSSLKRQLAGKPKLCPLVSPLT